MNGPDSTGRYLNFQHLVGFLWSQDEWLQNVIPHHEDEVLNRLFLYGVNHITDDCLKSLTNYAVLDDLTETPTSSGVIRFGPWPHRLRVYTDGMGQSQDAREKIVELLAERGKVTTKLGSICRMRYTGRRQYESANGYCAQVTLQPEFTN